MPEGDSVAKNAARLRPVLVGETISSVDGTAPAVRVNSARLIGAEVHGVRTLGKNLVIDLDSGYSIRVHLGMPGRWRMLSEGESSPGSARLVLGTRRGRAACIAATVEVERTPRVDMEMQRLGPDVLDEAFDPDVLVERAKARSDLRIAEALLDQRVVAGIGNVYKSELLFLAGIHPQDRVEDVPAGALRDIATKAALLMRANVRSGPRVTTGDRRRGREVWVYDRGGKPCRRCGTAIEEERLGGRVTYWCPTCQPPAREAR